MSTPGEVDPDIIIIDDDDDDDETQVLIPTLELLNMEIEALSPLSSTSSITPPSSPPRPGEGGLAELANVLFHSDPSELSSSPGSSTPGSCNPSPSAPGTSSGDGLSYETILRKFLEGVLNNIVCNVCLHLTNKLYTLGCGHELCRDCLKTLYNERSSAGGTSCPFCRRHINVTLEIGTTPPGPLKSVMALANKTLKETLILDPQFLPWITPSVEDFNGDDLGESLIPDSAFGSTDPPPNVPTRGRRPGPLPQMEIMEESSDVETQTLPTPPPRTTSSATGVIYEDISSAEEDEDEEETIVAPAQSSPYDDISSDEDEDVPEPPPTDISIVLGGRRVPTDIGSSDRVLRSTPSVTPVRRIMGVILQRIGEVRPFAPPAPPPSPPSPRRSAHRWASTQMNNNVAHVSRRTQRRGAVGNVTPLRRPAPYHSPPR